MTIQSNEIISALELWGESFTRSSVGEISALYSDKAILLGTLSPIYRDTPELVYEYFESAFSSTTERKVHYQDFNVEVSGDMASASGLYHFEWVSKQRLVVIAARFTFVFKKVDDELKIIHHHSSKLPV
ncbi:hypothetical protein H744_1c1192 [Photobacterium gaetbulicola Gung47]|uniref:SnoaL-like domain-containing protein n=1 Tax=Photobacterium gaetbulicola Gung47 TaxID=658445 RepID=A0A0C5WJ58_9GAMM|nr:nuclear transport factor 2 family protein [Photobacterium gaetbulicola]AJR06217.1 hypothetical protein H744_1c1192 [Photobacterium gaetbulicola Gung47]